MAKAFLEFLKFFNVEFCTKCAMEKRSITMRDILAIMDFIIKC